MFGIVQVNNSPGTQGPIYVRKEWAEAVDLAVKIALENLTEPGDPTEDEVREEVEESSGYTDNNGEWAVCIESIDDENK